MKESMEEIFKSLSAMCGSHTAVAKELGYSVRHYRLLRWQVKNAMPICDKAQRSIKTTNARLKKSGTKRQQRTA